MRPGRNLNSHTNVFVVLLGDEHEASAYSFEQSLLEQFFIGRHRCEFVLCVNL
jgi:hypothetical protein